MYCWVHKGKNEREEILILYQLIDGSTSIAQSKKLNSERNRAYVLWDTFLCNVSNTVVVYLISNLGEFVGEVFSDFPNESAFEPSVVKIYQESIDFRESIDYQPDHLYNNCFLNFNFPHDFAGVMVSVFAP